MVASAVAPTNAPASAKRSTVKAAGDTVRLVRQLRAELGTEHGTIKRIADQLGIHPEALRTWVRQAEIDDGVRPGTTSEDTARIAELEREVRELRRANEILKTSAAFFAAAELDRRIK